MELHISVVNKVATYLKRDGDIVCGNTDYTILFSFDSEWDNVPDKKARFIWNDVYADVDIVDGVCSVPLLQNTESVQVGVYGGELQTTTSAVIGCRLSILCPTPNINPDDGKVYETECQRLVNEAVQSATSAMESATVAEENAKTAVERATIATDKATQAESSAKASADSANAAENSAVEAAKSAEIYTSVVYDADYEKIYNDSVSNGYLSATDGSRFATHAAVLSKYIYVDDSYTIDGKLFGMPEYAPIVFYNEYNEFISAITVETKGVHTLSGIVPPTNAVFMRFHAVVGLTEQCIKLVRKNVQSLTTAIERNRGSLWGKTITATGDSITAETYVRTYGYVGMIAARNNMFFETKAVWGATIARDIPLTSGCVLETLEGMNANADYVILSGGANDFYAIGGGRESRGEITVGYDATLDETTLCGAMESLCKQAINKWVGKKLLFVITHRIADITDQEALRGHVDTMIEILEKWGIPYVDLYHDMPSLGLPALKNLYTTNGNTEYTGTGDGLHPNKDGYKLYYVPRIEAKLKEI